jgi:hypothetical protein
MVSGRARLPAVPLELIKMRALASEVLLSPLETPSSFIDPEAQMNWPTNGFGKGTASSRAVELIKVRALAPEVLL